MHDVTIRHNPARHRFEVMTSGTVIGKAVYTEYDGGASPERIFYHTVINEEYGGQGLAGKLAKVALTETVESGRAIVAVCPYIKKYVRKHPEFAEAAVAITPAHLEFLNDALAARA